MRKNGTAHSYFKMIRHELHTKDGIITGSLKDLKKESESIEGPWIIYMFADSCMNEIKINHYRKLTIEQYKKIHKMAENGRSLQNIGLEYHLSFYSVKRIATDEFNIIHQFR